jgi:splicing suppressor protein 51
MSILLALVKADRQQSKLVSCYINVGEIIKLIFTVSYEPYCYQCYRRESQLEDGAKLNACQYCLLTSFCPSCQQTHPPAECAILQDIVADDKIMIDLHRRTGKSSTVSFTKLPRKQHVPLSSTKDWYDYYTRLSVMGGFQSKMNRDLKYLSNDPKEREFVEYIRCGTNTTTIQLTLIAALEAIIPDISTRVLINLHIIGAAGAEFASIPAFEELLHLLPSLSALQLSFVGLNVSEDTANNRETQNPQIPHKIQCCNTCTKIGRTISITTRRGPYHAYINTELYKVPDLAAAFHSGFSVDEQANWYPTIKYLAHAPHPTLFTAARYFEIRGEMGVWKNLGAEFAKNAEVNKWKGMSPSLVVCGDKPNEVIYQNHWWYIVKQR